MDLSRKEFDVAGAVEEGATLHLIGPFDGKPIYDQKTDDAGKPLYGTKTDSKGKTVQDLEKPIPDLEKPVTISMRGMESETVRKVAKKHERMAAKGVKLDPETVGIETFQKIVMDWQNIGDATGNLECSPENIHKVFVEHDWIGKQVLAFSMDRSNFFIG